MNQDLLDFANSLFPEPARSSDSVSQFVAEAGPLAERVGQRLGVDPAVLLGQWGLETGWGKSVIPGTNNYGNIKDFSGSGVSATDNMTGSRDKYRAYQSPDEFGDDFAGLIERRYQGATNAGGDALRFASALKAGGYAEDPDYVNKLVSAADMVRGTAQPVSSVNPDWQRRVQANRQAASDAAPFSTSFKRGMASMQDSLANVPDVVAGDEQSIVQRLEEARQRDLEMPMPTSAQGFLDYWKDGNYAAALLNPMGMAAAMTEQLPNSIPSMVGSVPGMVAGGVAGSSLGPMGTLLGSAIGGFIGSAPGSVALEMGARITEMAARDGVDLANPQAMAGWLSENRDMILEEGFAKGLTVAGMDGIAGGIGMRIVAGPALKLRNAESQVLARLGATDDAAIKAAQASAPYKAAMAPALEEFKAATTVAQNAMRGAASFVSETVGEGAGEYYGEVAARGEGDLNEALLEAVMAGGQSAITTGAQALGSRMLKRPENIPNSPLTNAANAGQNVQDEQPVEPAEPTEPELSPFDQRLEAAQSMVEDKAFIQAVRGTEGLGPESVTEVLSAFAKARNPNLDERIRDRALTDLEGFIQTFANRPNFVLRQDEEGGQIVPTDPTISAQGQIPTQLPNAPIDGEVITRELPAPDEYRDAFKSLALDFNQAPAEVNSRPQILTTQQIRDAIFQGERLDGRSITINGIQRTLQGPQLAAARKAEKDAKTRSPDALSSVPGIAKFSAPPDASTQDSGVQDEAQAVGADENTQPGVPVDSAGLVAGPNNDNVVNETPDSTAALPEAVPAAAQAPDQQAPTAQAPPSMEGAREGVQADTQAGVRAYSKQQADRYASILTNQGLPSEVTTHPTEPGKFAVVPAGTVLPSPTVQPTEGDSNVQEEGRREALLDEPAAIKSDLDAAAHEAATSPLNDRKEPTDKQKEAGNFKVGRVRIFGMEVSIENPKGSIRSGIDKDGNRWERVMQAHYGYFVGTKARDGDNLDVYLGDDAENAKTVFVIDQIKADGTFDEHKTVVGPDSEEAARALYLAHYPDDWTGLGAITSMPVEAFKAWALDGKKKRKPLAYVAPQDNAPAAVETTLPAQNSASVDALDATQESAQASEDQAAVKESLTPESVATGFEQLKASLKILGDPDTLKQWAKDRGIAVIPRKDGVVVPNRKQWDAARKQIPMTVEERRVEGVPDRLADVTLETYEDGSVKLIGPSEITSGESADAVLARYAKNYATEAEDATVESIDDVAERIADDAAAAHVEDGEAQQATPAVVAGSVQKSADETPLGLKAAKAYLLSEIDKAIKSAPSERPSKEKMDAADRFVTFDVPGDGKFKVLNTVERLKKFRSTVNASPGFSKPRQATKAPSRFNPEVSQSRYSVTEMLDDGDLISAYEYAKSLNKPLLFGRTQAAPLVYLDAGVADIPDVDAMVGQAWKVVGKQDNGRKWHVIDLKTGQSIASGEDKASAVRKARDVLEDPENRDRLHKILKETQEKEPYSQEQLADDWLKWAEEEQARIYQRNQDEYDGNQPESVKVAKPDTATAPQADTEERATESAEVAESTQSEQDAAATPGESAEPVQESTEAAQDTITPDQAIRQMEWRDLGQRDGERRHRLMFKEDGGEITVATLSKFGKGKWQLDDADLTGEIETYDGLREAKKAGQVSALKYLEREGYVAAQDGDRDTSDDGALWDALPVDERRFLLRGQFNSATASEFAGKSWGELGSTGIERARTVLGRHDSLIRALTSDVVSPSEYPTDAVAESYRHISHHPGDAAMVARNAFLTTIQDEYDAAITVAETDEQKAVLLDEIEALKSEYLRREAASHGARGNAYSAKIAGRGNLDSKMVARRNATLDRQAVKFADWVRGLKGGIKDAVLAARNGEQLASEQQSKDEKAAKRRASLKEHVARLLSFSKGDGSKFGAYPIARVTMGRDGYPSSVTVEATDLTDNKFDIAKTLFGGDKAKLRALVDEIRDEAGETVNAQNDDGLTEADRILTLKTFDDIVEKMRDGTLSVQSYQDWFSAFLSSQDSIQADLHAKKKDDLLRMGGRMFAYRMKSEKKDRIIASLMAGMRDEFALGRPFGPTSYVLSAGALQKYEADKLQGLKDLVSATTEDDLKAYADRIAESRAEYKARVESYKKSLTNPETLDDFRTLMDKLVDDGMTRNEAYRSLKPAQRITFDKLDAESTRASREASKPTVQATAKTVAGEIVETKHTRDGYDLFVVKPAERVERDTYNAWNATAKRLGGWYSKFRGNGAVPGFQFKTRENADAFLQFIGGDAETAQEAVKSRRDAFDDDKSQSAVERLRDMAGRLDDRADESLSADRKVNTNRRARMAASAEASANSDKALAKTMRNLAGAIEGGTTQFLDRVRQKVQVEMLSTLLANAKREELSDKYPSYAEQQKHDGPATVETVDYVRFPEFVAFRSDLARLGREFSDHDGAKKLGERLLRVANDVTDAYLEFAKENFSKVAAFAKTGGEIAGFKSREMAEKTIARSGYRGQAIVLPLKRGENVIILSPQAAQERGIWQGDPDKKITLNPEFAEEVVQKARELNRGSRKVDLPWIFETAFDRRRRLADMNIRTGPELRSALREFVGLKSETAKPDRVKELERAMVGRQNDGLDFFPTPAHIADEMVEAAGIEEGMAVLEPSAGMGHIAERIRASGVDPDVVEASGSRRELLEAKGFNVVGQDFMSMSHRGFTYGDVFRDKDGAEGIMRGSGGMGSNRVGFYDPAVNFDDADSRRQHDLGWRDRDDLVGIEKRGALSGYDRILMNPPFSNRRDAEHVRHAYTLLRPGGRLVAIMGEGVFFGQDAKAKEFRDWLDEVDGTSEKLPEGTFNEPTLPVNTGVNARMVVIDKGVELYSRAIDNTNFRTKVFTALAQFDEFFEQPTPSSKSLKDIAHEIDAGFRVEAKNKLFAQNKTKGKAVKAWEIYPRGQDVRSAYVFEDARGRVWLDVARFKPGVDQGTKVYGIVAGYAHNNGKVFIGDPAGLSESGFHRRLENMISSALKYGTTDHLYPHAAQTDPAGYFQDQPEVAKRLKGLGIDWKEGDFAHNLTAMLEASYNATVRHTPAVKNIIYDFDSRQFVDAESGARRSRGDLASLPRGDAGGTPDSSRGGSRTYARAAIYNALVRGRSQEARRNILAQLGDQLQGRGLDVELGRVAYNVADPSRRRFILSAAAALAADPKVAVAQVESSPDLTDRLSPEIEAVLRDGSVSDALNAIAKSGPESLRSLAKKIADLVPSGIKASINDTAQVAYHGKVTIKDGIKLELFTAGDLTGLTYETFLHESLHAGIASRYVTLQNEARRQSAGVGSSFKAATAIANLRKMWQEYRKIAGRMSPDAAAGTRIAVGESYDSMDEFFVRALTDPEFQNFLAEIQYKDTTLLGRFFDWIKRMLGLKTERSWLDEALKASDDVLVSAKDDAPVVGGETVLYSRAIADAISNIGTTEGRVGIMDRVADYFSTSRTFNWWQRTVGSQYGKAKRDPEHFGRVFEHAKEFIADVSRFANRAAEKARSILPHMDTWGDIVNNANIRRQWEQAKGYQELASALFTGTLEAKTYTDYELESQFGLEDKLRKMYREFRAAVDASLDDLASSELARAARAAKLQIADQEMSLDEALDFYTGQLDPGIDAAREAIEDIKLRHEQENEALDSLEIDETYDIVAVNEAKKIRDQRQKAEIAEAEKAVEDLIAFRDTFTDKAEKIRKLQDQGYAPLMRFGQYTVDVVRMEDGEVVMNDDGEPDRPFFGMFESEQEAKEYAKLAEEEYPGYTVSQGILSTKSAEMYRGLTPETAEMFARMLGTTEEDAFQAYLKQAINNRSAMKRLIKRKGMDGFSKDVPRVLAAFVTSNARLASGNWHFGDMAQAINDIPQSKGDVKDEAIKLAQYIQNPQEEAAGLRGFMFFTFLGGSVASAMVNMTQTFSTTLPYISQFAGMKTPKIISDAMRDAGKVMFRKDGLDNIEDAELKEALHRASNEGVVDPQEIHLLMAESGSTGNIPGRIGEGIEKVAKKRFNKDLILRTPAERAGRAFTQAWGSLFGFAEKYNRHVAFIAAWNAAPPGVDRYQFAVDAVDETQFRYTKESRPNWGRGAVGATLFCVDDTTEALTQRGWLGPDDLKPGDMLASFDMDAGKLKWAPMKSVHVFDHDGEMVHATSKTLDMLMTPDHRVVHYRRVRKPGGPRGETIWRLGVDEAQNIPTTSRVQIPTSAEFDHEPTGEPIDDAIAPLVGWIATEGYFMKEGGIRIYQNEGDDAEQIRRDLKAAGFTWREFEHTYEGGNAPHKCFFIKKSASTLLRSLMPGKHVTPELIMRMTKAQIEQMVDRMIRGDGSVQPNGYRSFIQNEGVTLESFQMALTILGKSYSVRAHGGGNTKAVLIREPRKNAVGRYSISKSERVHYRGRVWCPIVPGTSTWVARRNGMPFITHNTFKTFIINYLEFLSRLPRKQQGLALGVLVMLSGTAGLPGSDDLDDVIDAVGQKLGYNWNNKAGRHAWLVKTFGNDATNFIERGISAALPLDVSARLSAGNLIPGTGAFKQSNNNRARDAEEFFGPAGSLLSGAFDVWDRLGGGKGLSETIRPIAPKAYNDLMKAIDIWETGYYRDSRGRKVVEADAIDGFVKVLGFHPNSVAEPRRVEFMLAQSNAMVRGVRSDIHELLARGQFEGDKEKTRLANEMLLEWNRKNPESKITRNPASVAARVRAMRSSSAERLVKATPRDLRNAVRAGMAVE